MYEKKGEPPMPFEPDYEKLYKIIPREAFEKLNGYIEKKLESYPVDQDLIAKVKNLTSEENTGASIDSFDIDFIIDLRTKFNSNIVRITRHDRAAITYLKIQDAKMLYIISEYIKEVQKTKATMTEKNLVKEEIGKKLGVGGKFSSTEWKLVSVAKIPFVENFCFLGIDTLKNLAPVVDTIRSGNPILYLLYYGGYIYNELQDLDEKELSFLVKRGANKFQLKNTGISLSDANIDLITKNSNIITAMDALHVSISAMLELDEEHIVSYLLQKSKKTSTTATNTSILPPTANPAIPTTTKGSAPTYNQFEETCLRLTRMMEDIVDDGYVPTHDGEVTATYLKLLIYCMTDLIEHWKSSWPTFN